VADSTVTNQALFMELLIGSSLFVNLENAFVSNAFILNIASLNSINIQLHTQKNFWDNYFYLQKSEWRDAQKVSSWRQLDPAACLHVSTDIILRAFSMITPLWYTYRLGFIYIYMCQWRSSHYILTLRYSHGNSSLRNSTRSQTHRRKLTPLFRRFWSVGQLHPTRYEDVRFDSAQWDAWSPHRCKRKLNCSDVCWVQSEITAIEIFPGSASRIPT